MFLVKEVDELLESAEDTGVIDTEGLISEPILEGDDDEVVAVKKCIFKYNYIYKKKKFQTSVNIGSRPKKIKNVHSKKKLVK